jgi:hypothetical protein
MWEEGAKILLRVAASFTAGAVGVYSWEVSVTVARAMAGAFELDWFGHRWETIAGMLLWTLMVWGIAVWKGWAWPVGIVVCGLAATAFFLAALLRHEVVVGDSMIVRFHLYAMGLTLVASLVVAGVMMVVREIANGVKTLKGIPQATPPPV